MVLVGADPTPILDLPPACLRLFGGDKDIEVAPLKDLDGYQLPDPVAGKAKVDEAAPGDEAAPDMAAIVDAEPHEEHHKRRGRK